MRKKSIWIAPLIVLVFYFLFFPTPAAELAVRKHLLFSFHPVKAFSHSIYEGKIKDDPKYGDLYFVDGIDTPFIYVKKTAWGWRVTSSGSGP